MQLRLPGYLWFLALPLAAYGMTLWWLLWRARARTRFGGLRQERGAASFAGPAALLLALMGCSRGVTRCGRSVFGGRPRERGGSSMRGAGRGASV